jgi:hypothetical protein
MIVIGLYSTKDGKQLGEFETHAPLALGGYSLNYNASLMAKEALVVLLEAKE